MQTTVDTLILGAGMSGLMAANRLQQAGVETLLLEKARGVGGRMATRRFGGGVFDHGAQFFT
ncbi:MAG: NAD(P)-binding protein, partial [Anaerolineales bacterium]|nr:NAD(P)-binding protein [Anaerolineales bacterium]